MMKRKTSTGFVILANLLCHGTTVQAEAALHLSLDTEASITQEGSCVDGFYWFQTGVTGKALGFDGVRTVVKIPAGKIPDLSGGFTVGAWVALEAYPWTQLAVIDQEVNQRAGYFLGMSADGFPEFSAAVGEAWHTCRGTNKLSLYVWNHLAGSWSPEAGLRLVVNGEEVAALKTAGPWVPAAKQDVWIGRNQSPRPLYSGVKLADTASQSPKLTACSLDGLIDEVRIESGPQRTAAITERFTSEKPTGPRPLNPAKLPAGPEGPSAFGAVYTRLRYTEAWEQNWRVGEFPDVLVRFDQSPCRLVFWRGTSYVPCWVTGNGIWSCNEFLETGENGRNGGAEPMADKQARNSSVRIIENTPARVVIHWRYAPLYTDYSLAHVNPDTGWGDWVDEYYTIYPDSVAVRKIEVHSDIPFALPGSDPRQGGFREYHEAIIVIPPGSAPQDCIKTNGLTLANMEGQSITYSWEKGPPGKMQKSDKSYPEYLRHEKPSYKWRTWLADIPNPNIHLVNLKAQHSPFVIVSPEGALVDSYTREIRPEYSIFPWWNHWPVAQIESGGRWAYASDRPSHTSLSHVYWAPYQQSPRGLTKIMLTGMTDGPATNLLPMAKSWLQPATLSVVEGATQTPCYDPAERAYRIAVDRFASSRLLQLSLACTPDHPAVNPAFVVTGWGERPVKVSVNNQELKIGQDFRTGFRRTADGTDLILWLKLVSETPTRIIVSASAAH